MASLPISTPTQNLQHFSSWWFVSTHLKNISQIGNLPQNRDENNKSLSCHHPVSEAFSPKGISFTYLMSFKLGLSMVPHGKQFSSTHCLGRRGQISSRYTWDFCSKPFLYIFLGYTCSHPVSWFWMELNTQVISKICAKNNPSVSAILRKIAPSSEKKKERNLNFLGK